MKKKRGYLWIDWVELGCRGWHIDERGAWLHSYSFVPDGYVSCCGAHTARLTRDPKLLASGCRDFMLKVVNDMIACGFFVIKKQEPTYRLFTLDFAPYGYYGVSNLLNAITAGT